jgi:SAM-dependent methyltransferase
MDVSIFHCQVCGHLQSEDMPDSENFYKDTYRISLESDQHDQVLYYVGNSPVFRTDAQAKALSEIELKEGASVLDFGAAKAETLRKLTLLRPDIQPFVFDVSEDYVEHWKKWLTVDAQACHQIPSHWNGSFDLITVHFVLEHVARPLEILLQLRALLSASGKIFFTIPNAHQNPGDILVADHVNHFTFSSIDKMLSLAGLKPTTIRDDWIDGAIAVLATSGKHGSHQHLDSAANVRLLQSWRQTLSELQDISEKIGSSSVAVYGAGFYGTLIATKLKTKPVCFLDRNPHLQGKSNMGIRVLSPEQCPSDTKFIMSGLNPRSSRLPDFHRENWFPAGGQLALPFQKLKLS